MTAFKIAQTIDLNATGPREIKQAYGHVGDKLAHEWAVTVVRGGAAVDLTGYSAMALVNNGTGTVQIAATISGNVATAIFPAACYTEGMAHECFMRISNASDSSEVITAKMHLNVTASETDNPLDPGTSIATTLSGLLASEAARVEAEGDRADAEAARAAFYDGFSSQLAENVQGIIVSRERLDAIDVYWPEFEVGQVYVNGTALTYTTNTKLVRNKQGTSFSLRAGDVLSSNDTAKYKFIGGYANGDGTYTPIDWRQAAYTAPVDGDYYFTFGHMDNSPIGAENISSVLADFSIIRAATLKSVIDGHTTALAVHDSMFEEMYASNVLHGVSFIQGAYLSITNYSGATKNTGSTRINADVYGLDIDSIYIHVNDGYKYQWAIFDSDNVLVDGLGDWRTSDVNKPLSNTGVYLRLSVAKVDDTAIAVSGSNNIVVKPNHFSPTTLQDVVNVAGDLQGATHLKVCSYNAGLYSYGVLENTPAENAVSNLKSFLCANNFDIIGLQENRGVVNTVDVNADVYGYLYKSAKDVSNWTCIKSQYQLRNTGTGTMTAGSRTYCYGTITAGGKDVFIMSVHLGLTAADRASNYTELLGILANHERFIVFGDFNAAHETNTPEDAQAEFDALITAGYRVANGGFLGMFSTYGPGAMYLDNICVSGNIQIMNSGAMNVYASMNSDHIPVFADLII